MADVEIHDDMDGGMGECEGMHQVRTAVELLYGIRRGDADYIVDRIDAECCRWCKSPVTCQPETLAMTEKTESLRTQPMTAGCRSVGCP